MNQVQPPFFVQTSSGNSTDSEILFLFIALILFALGWLFFGSAFARFTGLTRGKAFLLWLAASGIALFLLIYPFQHLTGDATRANCIRLGVEMIMLSFLSAPFVVRLYRKWIGGHLTEVEKLPGIDGVRAWLGVGNIICAGVIPICVWQIFGYSPVGILALTFGALLAYPMLNMASDAAQPATAVPAEDLSREREKVLQLLETGKISPVESAELLNALGQCAPPPKPAAEINPQRKLVLIGAAVLLLGFFLPWFSINPGAMMNEATSQLQQNMNQMIPGNVMPQINISLQTGTVQVHAGDVAHGLGWWILALGLAAAVLPFFATTLESSMQKKFILAALGIGAILLIYLLSDTLRYVSFGILLALAGYALEMIGTLKGRPAAR